MKWVKVLLWLALVSLVWGVLTRVVPPLWGRPIGVTPSAFLRFANTLVFFAIAIALVIKFSRSE